MPLSADSLISQMKEVMADLDAKFPNFSTKVKRSDATPFWYDGEIDIAPGDVVPLMPYGPRAEFVGVKIIESLLMVDLVEDWSRVRSPSRARRRMRYGHKQNVQMITVPKKEVVSMDGGKTLVMHPEVARVVSERIAKQAETAFHKTLFGDLR